MNRLYPIPVIISLFALTILTAGCGKETVKNTDSTSSTKVMKKNFGEPVAPNHCVIVGTVLKIDTALESYSEKNPCSKQPCVASVSVDSVLGYGAAFPPLTIGKPINLKFAFTLGPTSKDLFPQMKLHYPGLKVGDAFKGVISNIMAGYSKNDTVHFIIYGYDKK